MVAVLLTAFYLVLYLSLDSKWFGSPWLDNAAVSIFAALLPDSWAERMGPDYLLRSCAAILTVGAILGLLDIQLFHWVPEPKMTPAKQLPAWRQILSEPLKNRPFRKLLIHNMTMAAALCILGPFQLCSQTAQGGDDRLVTRLALLSKAIDVASSDAVALG